MKKKKSLLSWIIWNGFIMGMLALGYFTNQQEFAEKVVRIAITINIVLICFSAIIIIISSIESVKNKLEQSSLNSIKEMGRFKMTILAEPVFMYSAWYMGYEKIVMLMAVEIGLSLIVKVAVRSTNWIKETPNEAN